MGLCTHFHSSILTNRFTLKKAIWHGISKVEGSGKLSLTDKLSGNQYSLIITDNGPGFDSTKTCSSSKTSYGMKILKQRSELFNKSSDQIIETRIESKLGKDTSVYIDFIFDHPLQS